MMMKLNGHLTGLEGDGDGNYRVLFCFVLTCGNLGKAVY